LLTIKRGTTQQPIQLSPPQTQSTSVYFNKSACISFEFRQSGSVIRYTINGDEPNENSTVYKEPICVHASSVIKAKSFLTGFISSSSVKVQCIKTRGNIKSMEGSLPAPPYNTNGLRILYDGEAGGISLKNGWAGFRNDTIQLKIDFGKKHKPGKINIGFMRAQSSWIFYPVKIELLSLTGKMITQVFLNEKDSPSEDEKRNFSISLKEKSQEVLIRIYNLKALPDWHPGKGNKPWLFMDEISVE